MLCFNVLYASLMQSRSPLPGSISLWYYEDASRYSRRYDRNSSAPGLVCGVGGTGKHSRSSRLAGLVHDKRP
jgi:hypothetical protein